MAATRITKVVASLPGTLLPDTIYLVRAGAGFDIFMSDLTGTVAYQINNPGGGGPPQWAAEEW